MTGLIIHLGQVRSSYFLVDNRVVTPAMVLVVVRMKPNVMVDVNGNELYVVKNLQCNRS